MKVTPYDDAVTRFLVASESTKGDEYLVDVAAFHGVGQCGCPHFQYRMQTYLANNPPVHPEERNTWRCKHIHAAREHLLDEVIARLQNRP